MSNPSTMRRMRGSGCVVFSVTAAMLVTACSTADPDMVTVTAARARTASAAVNDNSVAAKTLVARAGGVALAVDDAGRPRFIRAATPHRIAAGVTPDKAARAHIQRYAKAYAVSSAALDTLRVVRIHDIKRGGIIVVLRQQMAGIDLYRADIKVLMKRNLELVAITGTPVADALPGTQLRSSAFRARPSDAVAVALTDHFQVPVLAGWTTNVRRDGHGYYKMGLTSGVPVTLSRPARAKKIIFPVKGALVPAWYVEFFASDKASTSADAHMYIVAGDDSRVLLTKNLTAHDAFTYRVWADPTTLRPADGPLVDYTPHPASSPDGVVPAGASPSLVSVDGFNTNASGQSDSWLASDATYTRGNNADAYSDFEPPDGFNEGDLRADLTSANTFDRSYDLNAMPLANADQSKASVLHAFYVVNWLHDWFYDSGFNENAGNGQTDNYGRGGMGDDELHIQVQDSYNAGQRSNANMSTPGDGASPRMQIYVWAADSTTTLSLSSEANPLDTDGAGFGPSNFNTSGSIVVVDDGTGTVSDGCEAIDNNVAGSIALIDRGNCSFSNKVENAQDAGAIGVLIANNAPGAPAMFMGGSSGVVTIAVLSLGTDDGATLKAALAGGAVTTTMTKVSGIEPDGGLDSTLVAHEWGHYIHGRLAVCGAQQCGGMGEGWGDFLALYMVLRSGDDLSGAYGSATYSASGFADVWFGTRRTAYSTDLSKNGLMFRHIANGESLPTSNFRAGGGASNNSEVHNTGEVWATLVWEAYVGLIQDRQGRGDSFAMAERAMGDYVVAGLQMTPMDATFTEARDAILAVAFAADQADAVALAEGFARRGAGSCAISPDRYSGDNAGVVESSQLKPRVLVADLSIHGDRDCDADGVLDAGESGTIRVTIRNGGLADMTNTMVSIATDTAGVRIIDGNVTVASLDAFASTTLEFAVELAPDLAQFAVLDVNVAVTNDAACEPTVSQQIIQRVNSDDSLASSATDTVEANQSAWLRQGDDADQIWNIAQVDASNRFWHGRDWGSPSDTSLESPDLVVSSSDDLVVTFSHRYRFEAAAADASGTNWDGAVIEISTDAGANWQDISVSGVDPGYRGVITGSSSNPLGLRNALVATSPSWPDYATTTLDFGSQFAGQTIRMRFRIGTDAAVGDIGWEIDDLAFAGIDNTPFNELKENDGRCDLMVDAGNDLRVESGGTVILRAATIAPDNATLGYSWDHNGGDAIGVIWFDDTDLISFTAPEVQEETRFVFNVTVTEGGDSASDSVDVIVVPQQGGDGGREANGCQTGSGDGGALTMLVLLLGALVVRRRRCQLK